MIQRGIIARSGKVADPVQVLSAREEEEGETRTSADGVGESLSDMVPRLLRHQLLVYTNTIRRDSPGWGS